MNIEAKSVSRLDVAMRACIPAFVVALSLAFAAPGRAEEKPLTTVESPASDPLEIYRRECMKIVGERWKRLLDSTEGNSAIKGYVLIAFDILPEGRPKNFTVIEQSEDAETMRRAALMAVGMSRFKPTPQQVLDELGGKPLRIQARFGTRDRATTPVPNESPR